MTESEAAEAERLWSAYHDRQESLKTISPFGFGERELDERMRLGNTESDAVDLILKGVTKNSSDLHLRKMADLSLALRADENGRPYREFLIEARRCELLRLKQQSVRKVEILTAGAGSACSRCENLHGEVWDIDEALKLMPIPCPQCTQSMFSDRQGFCGCMYTAALGESGAER